MSQALSQARITATRYVSLSIRGFLLLAFVATLVRGLWLTWQPLWWDEGYSFYFATEPVSRMVALTAEDIHPPFYYLLLHSWFIAGVDPLRGRLFSVLVGALAIPLLMLLAGELYPQHRRLQWIAAILLLFNPLHLYYSQEVRMYGLALTLGIAATLFLVRSVKRIESEEGAISSLTFYWLFATLSLYTLYYLGFLLLAQAIWAIWRLRTRWRSAVPLAASWLAIVLAYLPWLLYAGLKLTAYVKQKVASDKDQPLSIPEFLVRHLRAFVVGHGSEDSIWTSPETWLILLLLLFMIFISIRRKSIWNFQLTPSDNSLLWLSLIIPTLCSFLINQQSPFFPENGERLLLIILPYFLLLLAGTIDQVSPKMIGNVVLVGLLAFAALGIFRFYTQPRYTADDYRPLLRQVVQQSTGNDTFWATFPWQIGFWRAYVGEEIENTAQPRLLSDGSVEWSDKVAQVLDESLQSGVLWFPSLLSIGSTLPNDVNNYLTRTGAFSVAERWFSETTRLDGWHKSSSIPFLDAEIDFGGLLLNGVGIAPQAVVSANQPVDIRLRWVIADPSRLLNLSFRLQDEDGRFWLQRDYSLATHLQSDEKGFVEHIGVIVPPGLPPNDYRLMVSVSFLDNGESMTLRGNSESNALFAQLGTLQISPPQPAIAPVKLPIQKPLQPPQTMQGVAMLGYSGAEKELLAGESLQLKLFYQKQGNMPQPAQIFVSLLDKAGNGVAGWEGWPLPGYTMDAWPTNGLVQLPVAFDLPATMQTGSYRLVTGLLDPATNQKSTLIELGAIEIRQRKVQFDAPNPSHPLDPQPLLGSHATLLGYDMEQNNEGLLVRLYWHVEQTLLPAHHIFVHFDAEDGSTLAQVDGQPITAEGIAPTGSWLPGEVLVTLHQLSGTNPDYTQIRVGLYNPLNDQRLPVSVDGRVMGDAVVLR